MIRVREVTKRFDALTAVDELSLSVRSGEIFALVGPDGAGKTTTLRMLAGLVEPDAGEIRVAGHDARHPGPALRDAIGYMAQRFGLYPDLTVEENMAFYADVFDLTASQLASRGEELLGMTRLMPFRKRRAGQLSGGMKQKLALTCTLLHRPALLLLDEPTSGVDPVSRREFWVILYGLVRQGLTVLVTTTYLDEAERANRVGLLYAGRLVRCDAPDALKRAMREQGFRLEGPDLGEVRARLEQVDGVVSVTPFGRALHLFIAPEIATREVVFAQASLAGLQVTAITPSLEDVFVTEVRKAERSGDRA